MNDSAAPSSPFDPPGTGGNGTTADGGNDPPPPSPPPGNGSPPDNGSTTGAAPPSAGTYPGAPSTGNGMGSASGTAAQMPNGMGEGEAPPGNAPSAEAMWSRLTAPGLDWSVPTYSVADPSENHYALETRAESLNVIALGDAVRRGETEYLRAGNTETFTDVVAGHEDTKAEGQLVERIGRGSVVAATKSETTVHGRMSIHAAGWSYWLSGEDSILLGGAMTDTWTGGVMIGAGMSDDLAIGAGLRMTVPSDLWLNQLTGMEERLGTAAADGVMVDLAGTLFEREYGAGVHNASTASFSGTVHQTQRTGFWPMMRVSVGVRNLLPGAGGAASEQTPPSPPPAGVAVVGSAGMMIVGMGGGAARAMRNSDTLPDAMRAARAAEDLEEISNLRHAQNTATNLDELSTVARNVEVDIPNGVGTPNGMGQTAPQPPSRLNAYGDDALGRLDDLVEAETVRLEGLEATEGEFAGRLDDLIEERTAALMLGDGEMSTEAIHAEIEILETLRMHVSAGTSRAARDPVGYLQELARMAERSYGVADPQTIAYKSAARRVAMLSSAGDIAYTEEYIDLLMMARAALARGEDPRPALRSTIESADAGSESQRAARSVLEYLESTMDFLPRSDVSLDVGMPNGMGAATDGDQPTHIPVDDGLGVPANPRPPDSGAEDVRMTPDPSALGPASPQGMPDDIRRMLDVQPEQLGGGAEEGATLGRLDLNPGADSALSPVQPQLEDSGPRWVRVEEGNLPVADTYTRVVVVESSDLPVPDTYEMVRTPEIPDASEVSVSTDTRAVVDGMPVRSTPDDIDFEATFRALQDQYSAYRTDSNWRGTMVYGQEIRSMREDLMLDLVHLGGDADDFATANARQLYKAIADMGEAAAQSGDFEKADEIAEMLRRYDVAVYDLAGDLAARTDEFEYTGRTALDPHIDQVKFGDWLQSQYDAATQRMADAAEVGDTGRMTKANDEVTYYQQMLGALERGTNPLTESGDQIAYLRATGRNDQADAYMELHARLLDTLQDPAFHRSADAMGDDTYAPVHFLRPELGGPPPAATGDLQTQVFDAEIPPGSQFDGTDMSGADYAANREAINNQVGGDDFARVPEEQPVGLEPVEERPRARSILSRRGAGPVNFDGSRTINLELPEGTQFSDSSSRRWASDMRAEANAEAARYQGGYGDYMDEVAKMRSPAQREADELARSPYAAARKEPANQLWGLQRTRDLRTPSEWQRMPDANSMRSWDHRGWRLPPTDRPRVRKSVRFGDAEVLGVAVDAEDVRQVQVQWRALDDGNSAFPWWSQGGGINRMTDPLNTDEAIRHVPHPRLPTDQPAYPSSWRASRQPGFGRLADAPGAFPFNVREQMIGELMQGKRIDSSHLDMLQLTVNRSYGADDGLRHSEWVKMNALLDQLRSGAAVGDGGRGARTIDWKTLGIMLDMADAATAPV